MNNSLDCIFRPKSIAVVGASAKPGSIGNVILKNLINNKYSGKIIPVNLKADEIESLKCYPSITDIPDNVEMAIIIAPRDFVKPTLVQCGEKGVKGLVVITSGFKEIGEEGAKLELELVEVVKKYNMRMVGPNCFGILNTDPDYSINATFTKNPSLLPAPSLCVYPTATNSPPVVWVTESKHSPLVPPIVLSQTTWPVEFTFTKKPS